jgi:hypothetical protein
LIAFCRTSLNYTDPRSAAVRAPLEVEVLDGRRADLPDWNECGFELVGHVSAVTCWEDEDQIAGVHHPELERLRRP